MPSGMRTNSFLTYAHTSFSLDTYWWTYVACKESPEGCFQFVDAFKVVCSITIFAKGMGDPSNEPTIVVLETEMASFIQLFEDQPQHTHCYF